MKAKKTILDTIGSTPMVRINALSPNPKVKIFAKLEGFNPTGSIKDRIAVKMIETAEREGRLTKGKTIIEPTSGNTGIGLAIVGIVKGYPVEIVMSEAVSIERRKIIRAYGGKIDYLVCAIGTSGTLMGLSRFLKVMNPAIKVVCAQPTKGHYIQGLKNMEEAIVPDIYDPSKIDVQELVESEEAIDMARRIISAEGIFAGMSSGAAMLAAVRTAARIESGNIVVVFPDRAEKYLSTTMFREFED